MAAPVTPDDEPGGDSVLPTTPSDPPVPSRHGGCRAGHRPSVATTLVSPALRAERAAPDPAVLRLLDGLSRDAFVADLETLAAHHTRRSDSSGFDEAATWAETVLADAGYSVTTQPVPRGGGRCRNVIADRPGAAAEPHEVVLVTAHLDSINLAGPAEPAPGADDNGSGSAGLLELARALADHPAALDLRLILFGGEEEGLFGSETYVAELPAADRARIRAVLNMDMIGGRNTAEAGVLLEGAEVSQDVIDALARAAATYTDLMVTTSLHPFNSDHVPFIDAGIPAVLTIEADDSANTRPHTAADTVAGVDPDLAIAILRMNVAYLVEALGSA
ncbi:M28 family metallopeptidase [Pseudonocardia charpentierae]|uniref:M28 family metallopeptidase n=1 Tax=Pseudonocardia charpentierae TaxID=3075545 RepID=A0ABU2N9I9_9PSEU|nr:M28 family metallopeptidase [Pseudonocardia sp. DSM 45834]MDT0350386.1 M28 family metallopeptidase [Pseudonocardia sp. DSM 45834]